MSKQGCTPGKRPARFLSRVSYQYGKVKAITTLWCEKGTGSTDGDGTHGFILYLYRGTWVAQSVKHPTLNLGSGGDLMVCEFEPHVKLCADGAEPAWDSLSLFLCPSPTCTCSHAQKKYLYRYRKTHVLCVCINIHTCMNTRIHVLPLSAKFYEVGTTVSILQIKELGHEEVYDLAKGKKT